MASKVLLCYGVTVQAAKLAEAIGVKYGLNKLPKECEFCRSELVIAANFCHNCGADIRGHILDISSKDLVEMILSQCGDPPRSVELVPHDNHVSICQILAQDVGRAETPRSPSTYSWKIVGELIQNYIKDFGISCESPILFALSQEEK